LGSIEIDQSDGLYAVVPVWREGKDARGIPAGGVVPDDYVLLYSSDLGDSFQAYEFPAALRPVSRARLEIRTGHNDVSGPPAIGVLTFREKYRTQWTDYHNLNVFIPEKQGGHLSLGDPIHVTSECFGMTDHSGGSSFAVTLGGRTHVVYGEVPRADETGNPTYASTIDLATGTVIARTRLATAPPKTPDVHSTPVIAADSRGFLHVLCGAHNNPLLYLRSLQPHSIQQGWTEAVLMRKGQTYATLICDAEDRLHSLYRVMPQLRYEQKPAKAESWEGPSSVLALPPADLVLPKGYAVYYHRLFIDRRDALYASFTFWEQQTKGSGRYPRALAISEDGGRTWQLVTTDVFTRRLAQANRPGEISACRLVYPVAAFLR
jgi:hypothetical protein